MATVAASGFAADSPRSRPLQAAAAATSALSARAAQVLVQAQEAVAEVSGAERDAQEAAKLAAEAQAQCRWAYASGNEADRALALAKSAQQRARAARTRASAAAALATATLETAQAAREQTAPDTSVDDADHDVLATQMRPVKISPSSSRPVAANGDGAKDTTDVTRRPSITDGEAALQAARCAWCLATDAAATAERVLRAAADAQAQAEEAQAVVFYRGIDSKFLSLVPGCSLHA